MTNFFATVKVGVTYNTQSGKVVQIAKSHFNVIATTYFTSECGLNFTNTGRCINGTESDNLVL